MKLITYEIRMSHVKGPDHDWWASGDSRVRESHLEATLERMEASGRYRNISVKDDPHEGHPPDRIETSASGLAQRCTVRGCSWSWEYD